MREYFIQVCFWNISEYFTISISEKCNRESRNCPWWPFPILHHPTWKKEPRRTNITLKNKVRQLHVQTVLCPTGPILPYKCDVSTSSLKLSQKMYHHNELICTFTSQSSSWPDLVSPYFKLWYMYIDQLIFHEKNKRTIVCISQVGGSKT